MGELDLVATMVVQITSAKTILGGIKVALESATQMELDEDIVAEVPWTIPADLMSDLAGTHPCPSSPILNSFYLLYNFSDKPGPSRLSSSKYMCVSNFSIAMDSIITTIPNLSINTIP